MIKSILLAVDGSVYTDAVISQGIDLAKLLNAQLRISTIVDVRIYEWVLNTGGEGYMPVIPANVFHDESYKFHSERADALLNAIDKRLHESKIQYELEKREGSPVEVLCDLSRQVDLLVMGARGDYARWGDRMLGQTLEAVSRQSHSPIMIVDKVYKPFTSVTCAYDRSEHSNNALKLSGYLAETLEFPIEVVSVFDDEEERRTALSEAQKYLEPYKLEIRLRHEAGDPATTIAQVTKDAPQPTVLVMGSYGRSRIREAILGSTTVQVMRSAAKPLILAR
jgi:nucleotide-binding universal stress UspA family protein